MTTYQRQADLELLEEETDSLIPTNEAKKKWTTTHLVMFAVVCAVCVGLLAGLLSNADRLGQPSTSGGKDVKGSDDLVPEGCLDGVYEGTPDSDSIDDVSSGDSDFELDYDLDEQREWKDYFPQCGCVSSQSPININPKFVALHTPWVVCDEDMPEWSVDKDCERETNGTFTVYNTGHSLKLKPVLKRSSQRLATLANMFQPVNSSLHASFVLDSVHFHWPAEHTINGKAYPLEAHFVHYSRDYANIHGAIGDWPRLYSLEEDRYVLAVVSVFYDFEVEESDDSDDDSGDSDDDDDLNAAFELLIDTDVFESDDSDSDEDGDNNQKTAEIYGLLLEDLIPDDPGSFFYYEGSLTTPACEPIVRWHLMEKPREVKKDQLEKFLDSVDDIMETTARAVQKNTAPVFGCAAD